MVPPVVRYMVPCADMIIQGKTISLIRLIFTINPDGTPFEPVLQKEICVFVSLCEARGRGEISIKVDYADTGEVVSSTTRLIQHDLLVR
jgi:hypothetical protein